MLVVFRLEGLGGSVAAGPGVSFFVAKVWVERAESLWLWDLRSRALGL